MTSTATHKKIKLWILLHFYQPWWQSGQITDRIVERCYRPIFKWLSGRDEFAFNVNITYGLLEVLRERGHDDIVDLMRQAIERGIVEEVGTSAYHSIAPIDMKLGHGLFERQIARDQKYKTKIGFPARTCNVFYLPEYTFDRNVIPPLKAAGYECAIGDDAIYSAIYGSPPFDYIPEVDGFKILMRSSTWGNKVSWGTMDFDKFRAEFEYGVSSWFEGRTGNIGIATDGETFGEHHRQLVQRLLIPMVEQWSKPDSMVKICPISEILGIFPAQPASIPPSSWSTESRDYTRGDMFPLWDSPTNIYHQALWKLVKLILPYCGTGIVQRNGKKLDADDEILRIMQSCCWWQVSGRPYLNFDLMMNAAEKTLALIEMIGDAETKDRVRKCHANLRAICHL
jgi:hypothetical protein